MSCDCKCETGKLGEARFSGPGAAFLLQHNGIPVLQIERRSVYYIEQQFH